MTTDFVPVAPPRGHRDNNRVRSKRKVIRIRRNRSPANSRAGAGNTVTKSHLESDAKLPQDQKRNRII